ncbi:TPA: hypothetical protein N0F65_003236 [Lagenidium giganteum]|uniref:Pre-mRNA-splicing factor SPF27 n=1 Tax=Lagenidium giganteum TaxID=4803 RepID=A0AAV2ZCY6_9STRA|nr:TPA: hypothetical protein N0F65_003236 [Lagenidium giganteum]
MAETKMTTTTTTCPLLLENQAMIDALGYIDNEYNDLATQQVVQHLIRAEMTTFTPDTAAYLAFLPTPAPAFAHNPRLQKEMKRVGANVRLNAIDLNRYQVHEPTKQHAEDAAAWETAVRKLQTAVEHQNNRVMNLELQQQYGAKVWKVRTAVLDGLNAQNKRVLEETQKKSGEINTTRKQQQLLNLPKLQTYQRKYNDLVDKNDVIQRSCTYEEQQAKKAKVE